MKTYVGTRTDEGLLVHVVIGGASKPLDERLDLKNHYASGFECGYGGSGAGQLALAILADALGDVLALTLYQDFKFSFIGRLPRDECWSIRLREVEEWAHSRPLARRA